jgi:DNA polymerase-1
MPKKKLYLVDGSTLIFRAYFAIRHLSNSQGFPTNAVYGFTAMVRKLIRDHAPDYLAIVFDKSSKTFRNEIYVDYKANRPPAPEDLVPQFALVREVTKAFNIVSLEMAGYEADDIIATLAHEHEGDFETVIVSSDKDLMQLITGETSMLDTMKDVHYGPEQVFEKMGVKPEHIIDYLALMGDKVDNIPGVPGIGKKSAAKLLNSYGSLDGVYEAIERAVPEIKGKQLENLINHREDAYMSQTLATAKRDVPIDVPIESLAVREPNRDTLAEFFKRLEFKTWHREFASLEESDASSEAPSQRPVTAPIDRSVYSVLRSKGDLEAVIQRLTSEGQCALEFHRNTSHPRDTQLVGVALASYEGGAWYVPLAHTTLDALDQLSQPDAWPALSVMLGDASVDKTIPNAAAQTGIALGLGAVGMRVHLDPNLASYMLNADKYSHTLENIALDVLDWTIHQKADLLGSGKSKRQLSEVDLARTLDWACDRVTTAVALGKVQPAELNEAGLKSVYEDIELPLTHVLGEMELEGVAVDVPQLRALSVDFGQRAKALEQTCHTLADEVFSVGSPKQLGVVLFEKLGLPPKKRTKTGYSTDSSVLEELSAIHPLPANVLAWRSLTKLKSTYTDALPALVAESTGRIHTTYGQTVAATGRLSSLDPNLQNIPIRTEDGRRIRSAFVPAQGNMLLSADYSQIELRILAHLCGSEPLRAAFREGADIHRRTASEVFDVPEEQVSREQRSMAKTVNFGILYGMSAWRLAREQGISRPAAKGIIERYYSRYPEIEEWKAQTLQTARDTSEVRTLYGRLRRIPNIHSKNHQVRAFTERAAINTPIQGTAADIIKMAMLVVRHRLSSEAPEAKMVLQVHDELLFDVPSGLVPIVQDLVVQEMEKVVKLDVPLVVNASSGTTWLEAH